MVLRGKAGQVFRSLFERRKVICFRLGSAAVGVIGDSFIDSLSLSRSPSITVSHC